MAKCAECGGAVADDLKFCGYCGAKLNIVSEHLGTRILGNTEVIMGALERIAPGAAQQYTLIGTVTDGQMAGGLILGENPVNQRGRFLWSDGEKLTEVANRHVRECFDRGALEFSSTLARTCKECLTTFHRTRGVVVVDLVFGDGHGRVKGNDSGIDWGREMIGNADPVVIPVFGRCTCPTCAAEYLQRDEWLLLRETSFKHSVQALRRALSPEGLAEAKRAAKSNINRAVVRQNMEKWKRLAEASGPFLSLVLGIAQALPTCIDRDVDAFRTFADSLPGLLLKPTASAAEWRAYQTSFSRLTGSVRVYFPPGGAAYVPYSMSEDASVRGLVSRTPNARFVNDGP